MNILRAFSLVLAFSCTLIGTNADKNPIGQPLGYYPTHPQSYYHKPASYYRKCPPKETNLDVQTLPDRNGGRPFHNCRYRIRTLEGIFYRENGTYYPCLKYDVLDVIRVGEKLEKSLQVMTGVQEALATKFPVPIPEASAGRPSSVTVSGGLVTEAFAFFKNTSVPFMWDKDENFTNSIQEKIQLLKEKAKPYRESQLELLLSLHDVISNTVDKAELNAQNLNQNRNPNELLYPFPFIVTDIQSFSTPTTRAVLLNLGEDHYQAERAHGIGGARIEFAPIQNVTDKMGKLANSRLRTIDAGDLGNSPQDANRNTVNMHQAFFDLARRTQIDVDNHLAEEVSKIFIAHQFRFKLDPISIPECSEEIEIDPISNNMGGSMNSQGGMNG